ncbi:MULTISPECIES: DUF4352 domain-containing protein [Exiguobacterium]|uniref:DUF4352 domain-containing protein n=1 Tax=Exiguobacterium TaxID=33986 RepID=UPI001AE1FCD7|nr:MULTISPECIES: DUF4352 domain-containing protein [Exiguobacterium]MCT4779868.1 DUF4352 domain-containing protein [Exiguobacterium soli]
MNGRRMDRQSGLSGKGTVFAILGVIVIGGVLGAMSDDEASSTDVKTEQVEAESTKDDGVRVADVGESVKVNNLTITVDGSEEPVSLDGAEGTQGKIVVITATIQNDDKEARTLDDSMFQLTAGGTTYDADTTLSRYANDGDSLFFDKINPGLNRTVKIAYEVPPTLSGYDVLVEGGVGTEAGEQTLIKLN